MQKVNSFPYYVPAAMVGLAAWHGLRYKASCSMQLLATK